MTIGRHHGGRRRSVEPCIAAVAFQRKRPQGAARHCGHLLRLPRFGTSFASSNTDTASSTPNTPPIIQINGANPAIIQVGAAYNDLGATITGPQADLNLGITTYVNGAQMSPVEIDTTQAATDTIQYVVTDSAGLTSTSTRTFIIQPANDNQATSTPANDNAAATTTTATPTTQ